MTLKWNSYYLNSDYLNWKYFGQGRVGIYFSKEGFQRFQVDFISFDGFRAISAVEKGFDSQTTSPETTQSSFLRWENSSYVIILASSGIIAKIRLQKCYGRFSTPITNYDQNQKKNQFEKADDICRSGFWYRKMCLRSRFGVVPGLVVNFAEPWVYHDIL